MLFDDLDNLSEDDGNEEARSLQLHFYLWDAFYSLKDKILQSGYFS